MSDTVSVRNWAKFQHYKKRNPPWIRLYTDLLDDREFRALTPAARDLLRDFWLLAAKEHNEIPADPHWIAWRLRTASELLATPLQELLSGFWLEGSTDLLASRLQDASNMLPQRQRQSRAEAEQREMHETAAATNGDVRSHLAPDGQAAYDAYRKSHAFPEVFDARLLAIAPGGIREVKGATWDRISNALAQLAGNKEPFNEARLRGYLRTDREHEGDGGW